MVPSFSLISPFKIFCREFCSLIFPVNKKKLQNAKEDLSVNRFLSASSSSFNSRQKVPSAASFLLRVSVAGKRGKGKWNAVCGKNGQVMEKASRRLSCPACHRRAFYPSIV